MNDARIIFAGTPAFATPTLRMLCNRGHRPVAVLTQPDRPTGRGCTPGRKSGKTAGD